MFNPGSISECIGFEECPRAAHRLLRNRFFDWFHQLATFHRQNLSENAPWSSIVSYCTDCPTSRFDRWLSSDRFVHVPSNGFHPWLRTEWRWIVSDRTFKMTNNAPMSFSNDVTRTAIIVYFLRNDVNVFDMRVSNRERMRLSVDLLLSCVLVLPCELHNQELDKAFPNRSLEGIFRPRCKSNGYYSARQCNAERMLVCR